MNVSYIDKITKLDRTIIEYNEFYNFIESKRTPRNPHVDNISEIYIFKLEKIELDFGIKVNSLFIAEINDLKPKDPTVDICKKIVELIKEHKKKENYNTTEVYRILVKCHDLKMNMKSYCLTV